MLRKSLLLLSFIVMSVFLTAVPEVGASTHHSLVSRAIMAKTIKVMHCEAGTWHSDGPKYFGGLGWLAATWAEFRAPTFPRNMADATPQQQAWAMAHLVGTLLHGWWPHQGYPAYCGPGY